MRADDHHIFAQSWKKHFQILVLAEGMICRKSYPLHYPVLLSRHIYLWYSYLSVAVVDRASGWNRGGNPNVP
jgi:hypothetical protein